MQLTVIGIKDQSEDSFDSVKDFLFAEDLASSAHTESDLQHNADSFKAAAEHYKSIMNCSM